MRYDVLIIGGGVAGLTCAMTLGSIQDRYEWNRGKKYLVIDEGDCDLLKAKLFNAPGVEQGSDGGDVVEFMINQLKSFSSISFKRGSVVEALGQMGNFVVQTAEGERYEADILVLATGMHKFEIKGLDVEILEHGKVLKPGKIKLKNDNLKIRDGLYVAGLLGGSKTMFAIASGDGAQVACDIFELWSGKYAVAHDSTSR